MLNLPLNPPIHPSPDWTEQERLKVIQAICETFLYKFLRGELPVDENTEYYAINFIHQVSFLPAPLLESNRKFIMGQYRND